MIYCAAHLTQNRFSNQLMIVHGACLLTKKAGKEGKFSKTFTLKTEIL